mmetsp:Transcript_96731/g.273981  ORF Transcript_96731/g.273981 Transcript_96731/m.273981 type:complete len:205 (-) Transcript_96731:64-678(-)
MGGALGGDRSVPPGGVVLYIQDTGCLVQPRFSEPAPAAPAMPEGAWQEFHGKVEAAASSMYSERPELLFWLLAAPSVALWPRLARHLLRPLGPAWKPHAALLVELSASLLLVALFFCVRHRAVKWNLAQDLAVQSACSELAAETGLVVQYRTRWTGRLCKPRGASPFRAVAIAPGAPSLAMTRDQAMSAPLFGSSARGAGSLLG